MKIVSPISSSLKRSLLYRIVMASILGKLISPKPAAFGSLLLGSWAYGAAAGARHLSAEVSSEDSQLTCGLTPNSRLPRSLAYILTWQPMGRSLAGSPWSLGVMLFPSKNRSELFIATKTFPGKNLNISEPPKTSVNFALVNLASDIKAALFTGSILIHCSCLALLVACFLSG